MVWRIDLADETAQRLIDEGLNRYNIESAALHDVESLCLKAVDDRGVLQAGLKGRTWGQCAEVEQLWVDARYRRQGLGSRLMLAFEQSATKRSCKNIYLTTLSFQAPGFYLKLGFEELARVEAHGRHLDIVKFWMIKRLR
ncbi:MAG: GNAT family N-acetyltransferase [Burkholderiaceae bacterium]|jgi:GNAT superfamily N-acetyltransferase